MKHNSINSQIILYSTPEGDIRVDTILQNETIWLTQKKYGRTFWCAETRYNQAPKKYI